MLMLLLAVTSDPPIPPARPAPPGVKCERAAFEHAGKAAAVRIRPLTEEPLARQERAVVYSEQGCIKPVTVRENIGG